MLEKTIKSKWATCITYACANCVQVLESFCEMYADLQHLHLKMYGKVDKVS